MENEAETWHTCLGHYPLQNLCFLFRSGKHSGCYGNLKFSYGGCDLRLLEAEDCLSEDTKSRDRSCSNDRRSKTNRTR